MCLELSLNRKFSSNICAFIFSKVGPKTKFNKIAEKNITYVWPTKSKKDVYKIISGMWKNIGRNFGELVHIKSFGSSKKKKLKISGHEKLEQTLKKNLKKRKGIIFFSAHFGNWELGPIAIKHLDLEPLCLYRKSNNRLIEFIIQSIRSQNGSYAPKGDTGAKKSFIWLRQGKSLALLMDQKLNEGPEINFLGKPAPTASFIAEIAIKMDLDIIPIKFSRDENFQNKITFFEKIKIPNKKIYHDKRVNIILSEINEIISDWILNKPDEWLWIHRRWKKETYL